MSIDSLNEWAVKKLDRRGFQLWQQEQRTTVRSGSDLVELLGEALRPVVFFLAKGAKPTPNGPRIGTLNMRAWTLIYALRPDLLDGETMKEAGERFGVGKVRMQQFLRELRIAVPDLHIDTDTRRGHVSDKAVSSERKRRAALLRWQGRKARVEKVRAFKRRHHEEAA